MKGKFLLVLLLSASLYSVRAQEEFTEDKLLGTDISSLLIILPIIMIASGLLFFLGSYLKGNHKDIIGLFRIKLKPRKVRKKILKHFSKRQKQNLHRPRNIFNKIKTDSISEIKTQVKIVGKIKNYFLNKITRRKVDGVLYLIAEAQKQITKGKINQAKKTHRQAYKLYYKIPIKEQPHIITELQKIQERITDSEKGIDKSKIEELAKELDKLKSETEVYVIFDKSNLSKKLDFLKKYAQKVGKQDIYGLKTGMIHLKDKLKDLIELVDKTKKETGRLPHKEKKFLTKIKKTLVNMIKGNEQKGIKGLKNYDKEFFSNLTEFTKKKEKIPHPIKEGKGMPEFLKPMKEEGMTYGKEPRLQKEKSEIKPIIEAPKIKMDVEQLKKLEQEEEKVTNKLQKKSIKYHRPIQRIQKKRLEKYNWEITADEIKRRRTKEMNNLLKEEEEILSKLNKL
ncbi:MAG: hypothetical protein ISS23_03005 [Nanoarchaeota archaeon]|nr:hypothetical protein [Nanoarchaeota archaeon]